MRSAKGLYLFYRKILFPALLFSALLSVFGMTVAGFFIGIGIAFIFLLPMFHYLVYEIKCPNEYFFYHNLGLSKLSLWVSTMLVGLTVGLTFLLI